MCTVNGMAKETVHSITPAASGDYESRSYRVEFNVTTQSGTLIVQTVEDNILEKDEQLKAVLSVPSSSPRVSEGTLAEAIVTIRDQTSAEVHFDSSTYSVPEGQPANLTLKLTGDVDLNVTIIVRVQTMDGSAIGVYTMIRVTSPIILLSAMIHAYFTKSTYAEKHTSYAAQL